MYGRVSMKGVEVYKQTKQSGLCKQKKIWIYLARNIHIKIDK